MKAKAVGSAFAVNMYCTAQKVRDANELLEDETIFTDEEIAPWIAKAQSRIDVKLSKRYVTPLADPVPAIVESIAQDMAAGMVLLNTFSNHEGQELINLGNQYLRRADTDLIDVVENEQLDGLPGVMLANVPGAASAPAMGSTTRRPSPIERIVRQW